LSAARPVFAGVLFFPVTPFTESGAVDLDALARHIANGLDAGPGGVFIACGTGESMPLTLRSSSPSSAPPSRWSPAVCPFTRAQAAPSRRPSSSRRLAVLHEQYLPCGIRDRDHTGYVKSIDPSFEAASPRW
jgi:hypothetical protein